MNGLIPDYITTQDELNQLEHENILEATAWATGRNHSEILTATFVLSLLNGNGRHARLLTDVLLASAGQEAFTWGLDASTERLLTEGPIRQSYIAALQAADAGNYEPLIRFVRT